MPFEPVKNAGSTIPIAEPAFHVVFHAEPPLCCHNGEFGQMNTNGCSFIIATRGKKIKKMFKRKESAAIMENRTGRIDRKDVFLAGLVQHARFEGPWEMPVISASERLPDKLLAFDHALSKDRFDHFVHFYIDDERFERIWKRPGDYLARLSKFQGAISPRLQFISRFAAGDAVVEHVPKPCSGVLAGAKRDRCDSQCPLE